MRLELLPIAQLELLALDQDETIAYAAKLELERREREHAALRVRPPDYVLEACAAMRGKHERAQQG